MLASNHPIAARASRHGSHRADAYGRLDSTITQDAVDSVTYWHVELDSHDVLLAENLPAESYLDMGNRAFFADGPVGAPAAAPDAATRDHSVFCRPFVGGGALVAGIRETLAVRAESRKTDWSSMRIGACG